MTRFIAPFLAAAFTALPLLPAVAGNEARVDVLPGWQTDTGTHMAGLRIHLAPGWKTYWRAPGEAGLPPVFDWTASGNVNAVTVHWPVPDIFDTSGATTLGYHDEIILPIEIEPSEASGDIQLDGALAMGICKDICMPMQVNVSATLPQDSTNADPRITLALDRRPDTPAEAGVVSARCTLDPIADGLRVTAKIDMPPLGPGEFAVIEPERADVWVSEAMVRRADNMLTATADLVPPAAQPFELDPQTLRLTVLANGRAVDIQGCTRAR